MNPVLSRDAVDELREQFSGAVVGPDDAGYDEMRAVHNGLVDKRPARSPASTRRRRRTHFHPHGWLQHGAGRRVARPARGREEHRTGSVQPSTSAEAAHRRRGIRQLRCQRSALIGFRAAYGPSKDRLVALKRRWGRTASSTSAKHRPFELSRTP